MILSNKRTIKALIRLRGCAGWYASLLFAKTEERFSSTGVHIVMQRMLGVSKNSSKIEEMR